VPAERDRIEPRLGTFDTAMIVVSLVIGIGIFRTPAIVAGAAGSSGLFFAAWALGGLVTFCGALSFGEIGSRFPRAGGYYKVVAVCYHPALAFMLNWAQALMQGAGAAGVAIIGAEYLNPLLLAPERRTPGAALATACALMLALLALNHLGIRTGARTQNVLSVLKIAMILGLGAAALVLAGGAPPAEATARPSAATGGWAGLVAASIPVFYAYGGYQSTMNVAGDVRNPRRGLPLAITSGMAVVVGLYLFINLAYHHVLGLEGVAGSQLVAAALARGTFGAAGEAVVSLAIFLSAAGFVNATILQMPRSYYAMAQDGALPAAFLRINPRTQVQEAGLAFFGVTMLAPALLLGSFEKLLNYVMFTDALTLVVVASTIFVLRARGAGSQDPDLFRVPGYPLPPAVFVLCLAGVAVHVLVAETRLALAGMLILLAGWPLFHVARRASGGRGPAAA
jgi:basic amino acid/polyamine antiporter, APA family